MIGIFGGTFNPIHFGHLRSALEIQQALQLDRMYMVPCHMPPHRETPDVGAELRYEMLNQALQDEPLLLADDCELQRSGPSYSIDTVRYFKEKYSKETLCLLVGLDAFLHFDTWHEWHAISDLAHIIVVQRPGKSLAEFYQNMSDNLRSFLINHQTTSIDMLKQKENAYIYTQAVTQMEISATQIRTLVANNRSARFLLPDSVMAIIGKHQLYKVSS